MPFVFVCLGRAGSALSTFVLCLGLLLLPCAHASEPMVATGLDFTVYLAPDGTVWTWGDNGSGQLGTGQSSGVLPFSTTPVQVSGLSDIIAVSAGFFHALALRADGTVWAWGSNGNGQLGIGTNTSQNIPVQVQGVGGSGFLTSIVQISCGGFTSYAVNRPLGNLFAWGYDFQGQVGNGAAAGPTTPVSILNGVRKVAGGSTHAIALMIDGTLRGWGNNSNGQVGDNTVINRDAPVSCLGVTGNYIDIAAGNLHSVGLRTNGQVYTWGSDGQGQLGNGAATGNVLVPSNTGLLGWKVSAGYEYTLVAWFYGSTYFCGANANGQALADPSLVPRRESWVYLGTHNAYPNALVGGFGRHVALVRADGVVQTWGSNNRGQLGHGGTTSTQVFTEQVAAARWSLDHFIQLDAGDSHSIALRADGTVWTWGNDGSGQLGDDVALSNKAAPVQVAGLSNVVQIAAGRAHSLALHTSGVASAWGYNFYGELGDDDAGGTNKATPVTPLDLPNGIRQIAAGGYASYFVHHQGCRVWGCGYNAVGNLGLGNYDNPVRKPISGQAIDVIDLDGGYLHLATVRADGVAVTVGFNTHGQLGNNTLAQSNLPVTVWTTSGSSAPLTGMYATAGGFYHTVGSRTSGATRAWGRNNNGQLGNNTTVDSLTPVLGMASGKDVAAGPFGFFSLGLIEDGTVRSVGADAFGQLGNNSDLLDSLFEVNVSGLIRIAAIAAGTNHGLALRANGTVHAWGSNGSGQLGTGSFGGNQPVPVIVATDTWKPLISVAQIDTAASEAGSDPGTLRFIRSHINGGAVTVNFTTSGTATFTDDYIITDTSTPPNILTGSVRIPAGQNFVDIRIVPVDDNVDEDLETATVSLAAGSEYRIGAPSTGAVNISDNDTAGFVVSAISANTRENDVGLARTFMVRLTSEPIADVAIDVSSSNTVEGLVDTNPAAGNQGQSRLTFTAANWYVNQTVQVFGQDDEFDDGDIPYTVRLLINGTDTFDPRYSPLDPPDVAVTNIDDDVSGVRITNLVNADITDFGTVTEAGGTRQFRIRLTSRPYGPVQFNLTSLDTTEGVLQAGSQSVTIAPADWATGALITVVGVDDQIDDDNVVFTIAIAPSISGADPAYNGLGGWAVTGTCIDNDTRAVQLLTAVPVALSEGGGSADVQFRLATEPIGTTEVRIQFSGGTQVVVDADPATAGIQNTLIIPAASWNLARTIRIFAVDDALTEASPHAGSVTGVVLAGSGDYYDNPFTAPFDPTAVPTVSCAITDNDSPGFLLSPLTAPGSRQQTTEGGATAVFTVRLATQPPLGQTVSLRLHTSDPTEGRLALPPIERTSSGAIGAFSRINFADPQDLSTINIGDSVIVSGATPNSGRRGRVVSVDPNPGSKQVNVTMYGGDLLVDAGSETVHFAGPQPVNFTHGNWNVEQQVTVTGLDDPGSDGDQDYEIYGLVDTSVAGRDPNYDGLTPVQYLRNIDNDIPGLAIDLTDGALKVAEADSGTPGSFTVRLNTAPTTTVTVSIIADGQVSVSPSVLTFTTTSGQAVTGSVSGYNVEQTVQVFAIDDAVAEEQFHPASITFVVTAPGEVSYNGLAVGGLLATVEDDDQAGIVVSPTSGLVTSEGGLSAQVTVSLTSRPTANVVVSCTSLAPDEGSLGTTPFTVAVLNGAGGGAAVTYTVADAVDLSLVTYGSFLEVLGSTANAGLQGLVLAVDNTPPGKSITIYRIEDGGAFVDSAGPESLRIHPAVTRTFTPANWYLPQSIMVTGVDDAVADGDEPYFLAFLPPTTADANYAAIDPPEVLLVNIDNDVNGVTVTQTDGSTLATEGAVAPFDTFSVVLNAQPTDTVSITMAPGAQLALPGGTTLTFTTANWNVTQVVSVAAVDDAVAEGTHVAAIGFAASGGGYSGLAISSLPVTISDNDSANVVVSSNALVTSEAGSTAAFTIRLATQPTSNVTIVVTSQNTAEGTVAPASLTFTPGNATVNQTVTVFGVDDAIADIDQSFNLTFAVVSADTVYHSFAVPPKSVINLNNDTAGFEVTANGDPLIVSEAGAASGFSVRLRSQPLTTVTIGVAPNDATEAAVSTGSLTFGPGNWNIPQGVNVFAVDDFVVDGPVNSHIILSADVNSNTDPAYRNLNPGTVAVRTLDNDVVGVAVSTPAITTAENGQTVSFTVQLLSEPTAEVQIPVASNDPSEAVASPNPLIFTPANWSTPQTVTVTPVDDAVVDGPQPYTVVLGVITGSADTSYNGVNPDDVAGINEDDDVAAFLVSTTTATTSEAGTTQNFTVVLASQPTAPVTVTLTGLDASEGGLSATSLTFDPSVSPLWNVAQTVTITGVNDDVDDGHQVYVLTVTASGDATYAALPTQTVTVTNLDNDAAAVLIVESDGNTIVAETGATDTYTIALASQPLGIATITVTPDSQVMVNGSTVPILLTFDSAVGDPSEATAWNRLHTITVAARVDTFDETNPHAATITHTVASYQTELTVAVTAASVAVTVIDNDPPVVTVNAGLSLSRATNAVIVPGLLAATDDDTAAADLDFTVVLQPGQGELWYDHGGVGAVRLLNGSVFQQSAITAGLISYRHGGSPAVGDGFAFRVSDTVGVTGDLTIFPLTITGFNPPVIAFSGATPTYTENGTPASVGTPVAIDASMSASDFDSTTYRGLTVGYNNSTGTAHDHLSIATVGLVSTVGGDTLNYNGVPVGTFVGGANGSELVISFTGVLVGDDECTAVLQALRFRNSSEDPVAGTRDIALRLRDDTDTVSIDHVKQLTVFAVNDPPTISGGTLITPRNVALAAALVVDDLDSYPLTLRVVTPPGKGVLSGAIVVGADTTLASPAASRAFLYSPLTNQVGADSFVVEVEDADGAPVQATFNVLIVGGVAARPWIVSAPPLEAEAGAPLSYDILVDFGELTTPPDPGDIAFSLVGTLPAGVTFGAFTPNGTNATLTLTIEPGATGVIAIGVVVTVSDGVNDTSGYQPLTIAIVPAGSLGG